MAATVAPVALIEQHRRAHEDRDVTVTDDGTGLSTLHVTGPSGLVHAVFDLVTQEGRAILKTAKQAAKAAATGGVAELGDARTLGQVRFDRILLRALTGIIPDDADPITAIRPTVHVTISGTTLAGLTNRMAELDGHGPMDPDLARLFALSAPSWERLFLDEHGMVTATDNYQPPEAMRRYLRARDRTCRFPGCRQPARRCQVDHNHDYALGGPTDISNLSCFCATHHALKHPNPDPRSRWTDRQAPGGVIVWTTPSGIDFTDTPPPRVMFMNEDLEGLAA